MTDRLYYAPRTDNGAGLLPPITKASVHSLLIYAATVHEWPMTNEQAAAEIGEAINHLKDIPDAAYELLSTHGRKAIDNWTDITSDLQERLQAARNADPTATIEALTPAITEHAQQTYALLSILDQELAGLTEQQTDPGRLP